MYNTKPITSIYLDSRRIKVDNTFPVKLRVTFQRKRKYYSILKESLSKEDFEKVMGDKPRGSYRTIRYKLDEAKHDADEVIKNLKSFTFDSFELEFFKKSSDPDDAYSYFDQYIEELEKEGRVNTADSYSYAKKSIQKFYNSKKLPFDQITKDFLEKYEKDMLNNGSSIATIGIYLRSLRTIVNMARKKGLTDNYPFGNDKDHYKIKNSQARKMALITKELESIFKYSSFESASEQFFFDLWKFSYLCGGMNVKDICSLKYSNIERGQIYFIREKSKRTNYEGKEVKIPISNDIKAILDKWGQNQKSPDIYIFPLMKQNLTPRQTLAIIKQTTKQINKYVGRIIKRLETGIHVTSYTARHSFATHLMRHGAPMLYISKQLGHSNMKTTAAYLENFEERQIKKWQSKVTDFDL